MLYVFKINQIENLKKQTIQKVFDWEGIVVVKTVLALTKIQARIIRGSIIYYKVYNHASRNSRMLTGIYFLKG